LTQDNGVLDVPDALRSSKGRQRHDHLGARAAGRRGDDCRPIYRGGKRLHQPHHHQPCAGIFSPGYWKNYQNHYTAAQFQSFINATLNFGTGSGGANLSVSDAVAILKRTGNEFERSLLTAELNVAALPSLGSDVYAGGSQTIATVLQQAYIDDGGPADNGSPTAGEQTLVAYLSGGGEDASATACLVQPPTP
jgi:hypothetical protein